MRTDFSQKAARRAAAIDAVHQNGKRVDTDFARHTPFTLLNGLAGNDNDQTAGHA